MGRNGPVGCWCPCFSSPHASSSPAEGFANSASSSSDSEATLPLPPSRRSASSGKGFSLADAGSSQLPPAATLLPLPPHPAFPHHAVGIEDQVDRVIRLLEWEEEANVAVAVVLHGFGGTGKTTLADAVVATLDLQGWDCFAVVPNSHESTDGSVGDGSHEAERAFIYMDSDSALPRKKDVEKLLPKSCKRLRILLTARDEMAADVISGCECGIRTKVYPVRPLHSQDAMKLLTNKLGVKAEIPQHQMNEIVEVCDGVPVVVERVGAYICQSPDKGEAFRRVIEWSKGGKAFSTAEDQFSIEKKGLLFDLEELPPSARESFLDVCSFFNGWDWDKVSCIVGEDELTSLRNRALLYSCMEKEECAGNKVRVRPIISTIGRNIARGKRFTSTDELTKVLEGNSLVRKQICHDHHPCIKFPFASHTVSAPITYPSAAQDDIGGIKGIWLQHNLSKPFLISADNLDLMHNSLRVLALGDMTIVVGDQCKQKFPHIIYFQAGIIPRIPLRPTQLQGLRFLDCRLGHHKNGLQQNKMSSTLKMLCFNGGRSEIPGTYWRMRGLKKDFTTLRILPVELGLLTLLEELDLSGCKNLLQLPKGLSDLKALRKLSLRYCESLQELPDCFGNLRSLKYLDLNSCITLQHLPESFVSLSSLEELDLGVCENLKQLPSSFGKLSSLKLLTLVRCKCLKHLPDDIKNLSALARIQFDGSHFVSMPCRHIKSVKFFSLDWCKQLTNLPKRFINLLSIRSLDLYGWSRLERLPEGFGQLKSLADLNLACCFSLLELSADFDCLPSLQILNLECCEKLEGKWIDSLKKIKALELLNIYGSRMLQNRWAEMAKEGQSCHFAVRYAYKEKIWGSVTGAAELMRWNDEDKVENILEKAASKLFNGDCLLTNSRGEPFSLSTIAPNTLLLLFYHYPCRSPINRFQRIDYPRRTVQCSPEMWKLLEEVVKHDDPLPFQMIYVGKCFGDLSKCIAERIVAYASVDSDAHLIFKKAFNAKVASSIDSPELVVTEVVADGGGRKRFSRWKNITESGKTFLLSKSTLYSDLQKLSQTPQESNVKLLTALFGTEESRATPIFIKNCTESIGVDQLHGKTVLLFVSTSYYKDGDMDASVFKSLRELYSKAESKGDMEIISIPIPRKVRNGETPERLPGYDLAGFECDLRNVPWLVLRNPWLLKTEVFYFLVGDQRGWSSPTVLVVVDPNGRIINKNALPLLEGSGPEVHLFIDEKM